MISNYLIIYRVAEGRAWSSDTGTQQDMSFASRTYASGTTRASKPETTTMGSTTVDVPLHRLKTSPSAAEIHSLDHPEGPYEWGKPEAV